MNNTILRLALIGGATLAVTGCTTDGYGYGGLSYGYASPYYGWYDDYYYPGTGYYVYERSGARHRWNDRQRRYWQSHRGGDHRGNWSGYHRDRDGDGDRHYGGRRGDRHDGGGHRSGHDGGHRSHGSGSGNRSGDGDGHRRHH